jgi:anti-sigma B factor antagonist
MEIGQSFIDDVMVINIFGELYSDQAGSLEYSLIDLIKQKDKAVLNLEGLEYIDSSGLGVLIKILDQMKERGGKLLICCASGKVMKVFEITKFEKFATIYESLDEALEVLKEK